MLTVPDESWLKSRSHGVMLGTTLYGGVGHILKIKPPLSVSTELLDTAIDVVDRVLGEVEGS